MVGILLDRDSYRAGSMVRIRLVGGDTRLGGSSEVAVSASIYRDDTALATVDFRTSIQGRLGFVDLWEIPRTATTGRYRLRIDLRNASSGGAIETVSDLSFAVWHADIVIENFSSDRRFYSPGDPIEFRLTVANEGVREARNLSVEVGEAQYPWIASADGEAGAFAESVDLAAGETKTLLVKGRVRREPVHGTVQYTAVVRSKRSNQIEAFRSTAPVFVRSPQEALQPVYPAAYIHSNLGQVRTSGYRTFYAAQPDGGGVFDRTRTSFRAYEPNQIDLQQGADGLQLELRSESGELVDASEAYGSRAVLRFGAPGIYTLTAREVSIDGRGERAESLEVSANVLPRSLAIVCAHPDDEFLHPAAIRTAVENGIPVHIIFLTCGDAGGSDRFFGVDYTPAEAIEFGHIRIAEARAAARHLGVAESNLHFLGLPDGSLELIRTEARGLKPVFAPLLGGEYAPYREVVEPNLPFQKHAVLRVLSELLSRIDPDTVYTSHPDERHGDHKAAGWFTVEALKGLLAAGKLTGAPMLLTDQFYGPVDSSAPFTYEPHEFYASGEAMARVQEAYWFYQSQGGNHARGHVLSYADLPRVEHHKEIVNWAAAVETADYQLPAAV